MAIVYKLALLFMVAPVIFLTAKWLYRSVGFRVTASVIHALLLLYVSLFILNIPGWGISGQQEAAQLFSSGKQDAYNFIDRNFILIDNSFDKALIADEQGDMEDSTKNVITDRSILANFLKLINEHEAATDLVICDIGFDIPSPADSLLRLELVRLQAKNKLLLSARQDRTVNPVLEFAGQVYGGISEEGSGGLFTAHSISRHETVSLPYKLYQFMDSARIGKEWIGGKLFTEKNEKSWSLSLNNFFPQFEISNEKILTGTAQSGQEKNGVAGNKGIEKRFENFFKLSQPLGETMRPKFIENLLNRKAAGYNNYIFIGTFLSPTEDIHPTLYKPLHGPVILLNTFYALHKGDHHLSFWLLLWLTTGFFLVTYIAICEAFGVKLFNSSDKILTWFKKLFVSKKTTDTAPKKKTAIKKEGTVISQVIRASLYFIFVKELHFVMLFILVILTKWLTGYLINALSLLVYFSIVSLSLHFAKDKIIESKPKH